ncbi:DUF6090 family protein [Flexithrix dorotheae]|uniref:DUF6090 family protein n=1 Tax=Flexithrix dorotheae TaxID=70993 RepID=UPI000378A9F4|nr:DUF6090 family protein [Flexithrix dorotheae]
MAGTSLKINFLAFSLEILSVLIGISIVFGINNMLEENERAANEIATLRQIKAALQSDKTTIAQNLKAHQKGLGAYNAINHYMEVVDYSFNDSMSVFFNDLLAEELLTCNKGAYEAAKSGGLDKITNAQLRSQIANYYEHDFAELEKFEDSYYPLQFHQRFSGYFSRNFTNYKYAFEGDKMVKFTISPKDFYRFRRDDELRYLLEEVYFGRKFILKKYAAFSQQIENLENSLDNEINALQE